MGSGDIEKVDGHWHVYLNTPTTKLYSAQHPDIDVHFTGYGEMLLFTDADFREFSKFRDALPDMSHWYTAGLALRFFSQSVLRPKEGDIRRMCKDVWMLSPEYSAAYTNWRAPHQIAAWEAAALEAKEQREMEEQLEMDDQLSLFD